MTTGDTSPSAWPLTTRIIRDEAEWDAIRPHWDALFVACPSASPPLDFCWLRGWWAAYGAAYGRGGLRIITSWRGPTLVATLPLYLGTSSLGHLGVRSLMFISTGEAEKEETCPEYLGLLCRPGEEAECADAAWKEIGRLGWDGFEFLNLVADSPLVTAKAVPAGARTFSRGSCPIADLTGGFNSYLERLAGKYRQQARRKLRDMDTAVASFEIVGTDRAGEAFDDLVRLHQERWAAEGRPGAFASPRFVSFHRRLIEEWAPCGRAILARLALGRDPVVVLYGFVTGQKFDLYQSGIRLDAAGPLGSPGVLAHLLLMQTLAQAGVTAYDFLSGSATYKDRLATRERLLVGIQMWRPTLRAVAYRSIQAAGRLMRCGLRLRTGGSRA